MLMGGLNPAARFPPHVVTSVSSAGLGDAAEIATSANCVGGPEMRVCGVCGDVTERKHLNYGGEACFSCRACLPYIACITNSGFTSWSSTRSPTDVFRLLETLFGAFDKIALRRGVFKVETIGDCYVAVTGLPKPQRHHASVMARFASECLEELQRVTYELEETLGAGTSDLKLRVGLHR